MDVLGHGRHRLRGSQSGRGKLVAEGAGRGPECWLARRAGLRALEGCPGPSSFRGDILEPELPAHRRSRAGGPRLPRRRRLSAPGARESGRDLPQQRGGGTRHVARGLRARSGVERVVYTSSVGTASAFPRTAGPGTETTTPVNPRRHDRPLQNARSSSPRRVADEYAARGAACRHRQTRPIPIGPWGSEAHPDGPDDRGLPARGEMFATVDTGLNLIHVADVRAARGILLAARLGNAWARSTSWACENHSLARDLRPARAHHRHPGPPPPRAACS